MNFLKSLWITWRQSILDFSCQDSPIMWGCMYLRKKSSVTKSQRCWTERYILWPVQGSWIREIKWESTPPSIKLCTGVLTTVVQPISILWGTTGSCERCSGPTIAREATDHLKAAVVFSIEAKELCRRAKNTAERYSQWKRSFLSWLISARVWGRPPATPYGLLIWLVKEWWLVQ